MTSEHPEAVRSRRRRLAEKERVGHMEKLVTTPEMLADDTNRRLRLAQEELRRTKLLLAAETARADQNANLRDSVFKLTEADFEPPSWPAAKPLKNKDRFHKPILFTSDFQYGEVVLASDMDGMNAFNKRIFKQRYCLMIDKTISWAEAIKAGWGAEYPEGIIYLRGGDAISGEIHAELSETNDATVRGALIELAEIEAAGILRLRDHFGHVHVISIPGNHGRTTLKPRFKRYTELNFETILADLLHASLRRERGVTFETPASGFAYFEAAGWSFEMRHGDRMGAGGGVGFIGAPAPITKGHLRTRLNAAVTGKMVDFVLTGHLHTSMKLPRGFANGSMPGYNEMARALNLDPDCAKQWLIIASRRHVYGLELELSDFPRRGAIT